MRTERRSIAWRVAPAATLMFAVIWLLQTLYAPTLLVGTGAGLETVLQALPATFVALLALGFGALFVVVQQGAEVLSTRSARLIVRDERVVSLVAVTLALMTGSLLLGGQVPPDGASPTDAVSAAAGTLMLGAVVLVLAYAYVIPAVLEDHTRPDAVVKRLLDEVDRALADGARPDDALASLRESERHAVARHDEDTFEASISGVAKLLTGDRVGLSESFAGEPLAAHLVDSADSAAPDGPRFEAQVLLDALPNSADASLRARMPDRAVQLIEGYARLGTRLDPPQRAADLQATASTLAAFAGEAQRLHETPAAATGTALWALCVAVAASIGSDVRDQVARTRASLGPTPPFAAALEQVRGARWRAMWRDVEVAAVEQALGGASGAGRAKLWARSPRRRGR